MGKSVDGLTNEWVGESNGKSVDGWVNRNRKISGGDSSITATQYRNGRKLRRRRGWVSR